MWVSAAVAGGGVLYWLWPLKEAPWLAGAAAVVGFFAAALVRLAVDI